MCAGATRLCSGTGDRIRGYFVTIGVVPLRSNILVMSRCFRATLSHWAETPEEAAGFKNIFHTLG
jgi:hypothetical protein